MHKKLIYFPEATNHCDEKNAVVSKEESAGGKYPCPCCNHITFPVPPEKAIAYICPVCFWENDVFISDADEASDENHGMTLNEARSNYKKIGACSSDLLRYVRKPKPEEISKQYTQNDSSIPKTNTDR